MKIIATVSDGFHKTFLAEVSLDELATIKNGSTTATGSDFRIEVGSVIHVGNHWRRVLAINGAQDRLNSQASALRAVADLIGTIDVVVPPNPEPPKD